MISCSTGSVDSDTSVVVLSAVESAGLSCSSGFVAVSSTICVGAAGTDAMVSTRVAMTTKIKNIKQNKVVSWHVSLSSDIYTNVRNIYKYKYMRKKNKNKNRNRDRN